MRLEGHTMKSTVFTVLACTGSIALGVCGTYFLTNGKEADSDPIAPVAFVSNKQTPDVAPDVIIDAVSAIDPTPNEIAKASPPKTRAQVAPAEPILDVVSFNQKIAKRTSRYIYRSWRVDVENHLGVNAEAYLEVEWLDADGFRVDYSNESRTLAPGVNVISDIEIFDREENDRVHSFRVTEIKGKKANETMLGISECRDKIGKRTRRYVHRSWRVDVVNNSNKSVDCYVEVEWLDADGHRIDYSNETRAVAPGTNVITDTEMFDREENARVRAFRVVKLNER
ncbi:hypothetical protein RBSWK_01952 [Rhodopirellula baltica SWK14]|uniref:Uncharacterized protein n=1 Tax=Rhodopirellula baltica SWK14 TaxID=993516 RepID=L7CL68_RHOBT|nr:hypothetical protein RBSWK_01952 [Rhodopirellula baltica SWK14]